MGLKYTWGILTIFARTQCIEETVQDMPVIAHY